MQITLYVLSCKSSVAQTHFDFSVSCSARGQPVNGNFSPKRDWCAAVNETDIEFGFRFMLSSVCEGMEPPCAGLSPCQMAFASPGRASCVISGDWSVGPSSLPLLLLPLCFKPSFLSAHPSILFRRSASSSFPFSDQADLLDVKSQLMHHDNLTQCAVQAPLHLPSI